MKNMQPILLALLDLGIEVAIKSAQHEHSVRLVRRDGEASSEPAPKTPSADDLHTNYERITVPVWVFPSRSDVMDLTTPQVEGVLHLAQSSAGIKSIHLGYDAEQLGRMQIKP